MESFGCKKEDCKVVVDEEGRMCFGSGALDRSNHWEFPCALCARENDRTSSNRNKTSWPLPVERTSFVSEELVNFGNILMNIRTPGKFGGFITFAPKATRKPTRAFIWHSPMRSFYVSMETGQELEEVVLA